MDSILFQVQGSQPDPYVIEFTKNSDGSLKVSCSCPAGDTGLHCKHRIGLLTGDTKDLVSRNKPELETVNAWLQGTDLEKCLEEYLRLEKELETMKRQLNKAKKKLAEAMATGSPG